MADLALALARARTRAAFSRAALARRMGISEPLIAAIESEQRRLTPDVAAAAVRVLRDEDLVAAFRAACPVCRAAHACGLARRLREAA